MGKPKEYYIAIDPKSVRKNPEAGMTRYIVPAKVLSRLHVDGRHELLQGEGIQVESNAVSCLPGRTDQFTTYVIAMPPKEFKALLQKLSNQLGKENVRFTMENQYHTIDSMIPAREFLYDYKKKRVQCCHCKARFDHSELYSVSDDDGDNYWTDENICPKCEEADCCKTTYQRISDFMLAKEQIPRIICSGVDPKAVMR